MDHRNFLTEYWVSQTRKYCDFCKCSISDNKPSIQFHENGKKHKENVRLRLAEMQKKATKDASSAATVEKQMKKMEEAAMKAYLKDIEANPDFTSQKIKDTLEANKAANSETALGTGTSREIDTGKPPGNEPSKPAKKSRPKKWMEAKTAEGHVYYWHLETGESLWEAPKEGFLSVEDQEAQKQTDPPQKPTPQPKPKIKQEPKTNSVLEMNRAIYGTGGSRPTVREEPAEPTAPMMGPSPRSQPYGAWTAVVKQEKDTLDLELPDLKPEIVSVVSVRPEDRPKGFRERKAPVSTSNDNVEVPFKKRKICGARNARQRGGDD